MSDNTVIEMNVDTFNDNEGFFVRTEIEVRSVTIYGPFSDLASAQKLKADQLQRREQLSAALREDLRRAAAGLAGSG
jgi:hypothetical protein